MARARAKPVDRSCFPLPLWEGVDARQRGRVRGAAHSEPSNPSSVTDFVRATFSHKGRRKKEAPYSAAGSQKTSPSESSVSSHKNPASG